MTWDVVMMKHPFVCNVWSHTNDPFSEPVIVHSTFLMLNDGLILQVCSQVQCFCQFLKLNASENGVHLQCVL